MRVAGRFAPCCGANHSAKSALGMTERIIDEGCRQLTSRRAVQRLYVTFELNAPAIKVARKAVGRQ